MEAKIKPKDLRVGNLVGVYGIVCTAEEILSDKIGVRVYSQASQEIDYHHYEFIEPIELTEEWLLKLGFCYKKTKKRYPNDRYFISSIDLYYTNQESFSGYVLSYDKTILRGFKYVHQLQNLYFALTGEELTLTETP